MNTIRSRNQLLKLAVSAALLASIAWPLFASRFVQPAAAQNQAQPKAAPPANAERFDLQVREDFFAGMAGDQARFEKAMKLCEEMLAQDPKHAEALVWHGGGLLRYAGWAFGKGELQQGSELCERGEKELNEGVALAPNSVSTRIPRGAMLLETSKYVPVPVQAKALLETAVQDYEKTLALQQAYFEKLGKHARGELLWGLASGW
ncbi:MAG: hypothetical protein HY011_30345 [Acidobacteria bacterium]|nr:hypothetical protein [Acidobacteriota bacterium]